jgi:molecular chaperone DnaK
MGEVQSVSAGAIVGIDLGTTNSVVATVIDGQVEVIRDDEGRSLVPSVVAFLPNGETHVGYPARARTVIDPENTVFSAKRLIGRPFRDAEVQAALAQLPYRVVEGDNQEPIVETRAGQVPVIAISAMVLRHLRELAQRRLGQPVTHCVVTVPANFSDGQREATRRAATIAGMDVLRVLNEPTAAAVAFGLGEKRQRIAVFDLGGGTFDLTVLSAHDRLYEVLATGGDPFLGGDDFNNLLADLLAHEFLAEHHVDLSADPGARARLFQAAEMIKVTLSKQDLAVGKIPKVAYGEAGAELDLEYRVARTEFQQLIDPYVRRTLDRTRQVLREAATVLDEVDEVALVGGSTLVPLIRVRVSELFGKRLRASVNPLEVVATGAALQADTLWKASQMQETGVDPYEGDGVGLLMDVTSHALGILTLGGQIQILIDKNTPIPTESRHVFTTAEDNQTEVDIRVFQGDQERAQDCVLLGQVRLAELRPAPRGEVRVEVSFLVDADGILRVGARDRETGRQEHVTLSVLGLTEQSE